MAERAIEASVRRREAAKALLSLRASSRDIRDWLPHEVVVVLDEDPVGATFEYLEQHNPDGGFLVRVEDESRIEVVEVRRAGLHRQVEDHPAVDTQIHPDTHIGMLFSYLRSFPGKWLRCIAERPAYEVTITDDGGLKDLLVSPS